MVLSLVCLSCSRQNLIQPISTKDDDSQNKSTIANTQELWQGTITGMTIEEVKQIQPHAINIDNPSTTIQGIPLYDTGFLIIEKYEMVGYLFDVTFNFSIEERKLTSVLLRCNSESVRNSGHTIFYNLYEDFTSKYGQSIRDDRTRAESGQLGEWRTDWQSGNTKIAITYTYSVLQSGFYYLAVFFYGVIPED